MGLQFTTESVEKADEVAGGSRRWMIAAGAAALLLLVYAPVLKSLGQTWISNEDMGHGFFVPAVAIYIAWQSRAEWMNLQPRPSWLGVPLLVWGALQMVVAHLGAEFFLGRTAFVISLVGMVLCLGGTTVVRRLWFPLLLLPFMIPLPAIIYNQITFPLQLLASQVAEVLLTLVGIPVLREGNVLEVPSQRLSVVEACSGIRSLLSLSFLSLVYGWFFEQRAWVRVVLFVSTIPIAITTNAFRVTLTGLMSEYDPELARGVFHSMEGWVIFVMALGLLVLWHNVLIRAARWKRGGPAPPPGEISS